MEMDRRLLGMDRIIRETHMHTHRDLRGALHRNIIRPPRDAMKHAHIRRIWRFFMRIVVIRALLCFHEGGVARRSSHHVILARTP